MIRRPLKAPVPDRRRHRVSDDAGTFADTSNLGVGTTRIDFNDFGANRDVHAVVSQTPEYAIERRRQTRETDLGDELAFAYRVADSGSGAEGPFPCSHTVHGILMGSRHSFAERGIYELKGVPGTWPLYAVQG